MNATAQKVLIALLALAACGIYGPSALEWLRGEETQVVSAAETTNAPGGEVDPKTRVATAPMLTPVSLSEGLFDTIGTWRGKPALADFNGDGHVDLVAALRRWDRETLGEGMFVWLGDSKGNWTKSHGGISRDMGYGGSDVADANGDGFLDIAFSGHDVLPQVLLGDGTGSWVHHSEGIDPAGPCSDVAMGDLDGDGFAELITMGFFSEKGGVNVFSQTSEGGWMLSKELLDPEHFGSQVRLIDIDLDGDKEIVATTDLGVKIWAYEDGEFHDRSEGLPTLEIGGTDLAIAATDLTGNGHCELLVGGMVYEGHEPLRLYRWDGAWTIMDVELPKEEAFFDVDFANLDGKGPLEIVGAGRWGISVLTQTADGGYERIARLEHSTKVINLTAGDINGDGFDEIVHIGSGGLRVFDLQGDLTPKTAAKTEGGSDQ